MGTETLLVKIQKTGDAMGVGDDSTASGTKERSFWKKMTGSFNKGLRTAGVSLSLASMLKQSQVFTSVMGSIFQILGAMIDVFLAPLIVPLFIPLIRWLARRLPDARALGLKFADWVLEMKDKLDAPLSQLIETISSTWGVLSTTWSFLNTAGKVTTIIVEGIDKGIRKVAQWVYNNTLAGTLGFKKWEDVEDKPLSLQAEIDKVMDSYKKRGIVPSPDEIKYISRQAEIDKVLDSYEKTGLVKKLAVMIDSKPDPTIKSIRETQSGDFKYYGLPGGGRPSNRAQLEEGMRNAILGIANWLPYGDVHYAGGGGGNADRGEDIAAGQQKIKDGMLFDFTTDSWGYRES